MDAIIKTSREKTWKQETITTQLEQKLDQKLHSVIINPFRKTIPDELEPSTDLNLNQNNCTDYMFSL